MFGISGHRPSVFVVVPPAKPPPEEEDCDDPKIDGFMERVRDSASDDPPDELEDEDELGAELVALGAVPISSPSKVLASPLFASAFVKPEIDGAPSSPGKVSRFCNS